MAALLFMQHALPSLQTCSQKHKVFSCSHALVACFFNLFLIFNFFILYSFSSSSYDFSSIPRKDGHSGISSRIKRRIQLQERIWQKVTGNLLGKSLEFIPSSPLTFFFIITANSCPWDFVSAFVSTLFSFFSWSGKKPFNSQQWCFWSIRLPTVLPNRSVYIIIFLIAADSFPSLKISCSSSWMETYLFDDKCLKRDEWKESIIKWKKLSWYEDPI